MRTATVRRIDIKMGCAHAELNKIQIPEYRDKGWYRLMISYSAFFHSAKGRNRNADFLYLMDDHSLVPAVSDFMSSRDALLPVIYHDSLYAFFDYIGYDRNRQKITLRDSALSHRAVTLHPIVRPTNPRP